MPRKNLKLKVDQPQTLNISPSLKIQQLSNTEGYVKSFEEEKRSSFDLDDTDIVDSESYVHPPNRPVQKLKVETSLLTSAIKNIPQTTSEKEKRQGVRFSPA